MSLEKIKQIPCRRSHPRHSHFQDSVARFHFEHAFLTPCFHTLIVTVQRNLRTLENYISTFLIEHNHLNTAVKSATKVIRFTVSESTGLAPFENHFGRDTRNVFSILIDLQNRGRGILENVYDMECIHLARNTYDGDLLRRMVFDRTHGRDACVQHLQKSSKDDKSDLKFNILS